MEHLSVSQHTLSPGELLLCNILYFRSTLAGSYAWCLVYIEEMLIQYLFQYDTDNNRIEKARDFKLSEQEKEANEKYYKSIDAVIVSLPKRYFCLVTALSWDCRSYFRLPIRIIWPVKHMTIAVSSLRYCVMLSKVYVEKYLTGRPTLISRCLRKR